MKFLDDIIVISEETFGGKSLFSDYPNGMRHCEWLRINDNYFLSVQASAMHYCTPRGNIDLDKYTHFEMAIIQDYKITNNTMPIKEFSRYDELLKYLDLGVFAYVPKDLIEDLYVWCKINLGE